MLFHTNNSFLYQHFLSQHFVFKHFGSQRSCECLLLLITINLMVHFIDLISFKTAIELNWTKTKNCFPKNFLLLNEYNWFSYYKMIYSIMNLNAFKLIIFFILSLFCVIFLFDFCLNIDLQKSEWIQFNQIDLYFYSFKFLFRSFFFPQSFYWIHFSRIKWLFFIFSNFQISKYLFLYFENDLMGIENAF